MDRRPQPNSFHTLNALLRWRQREWLATFLDFYAAVEAAYPPGFWTDFERLRAGDPAGLESD